jgi:hypothetical protein
MGTGSGSHTQAGDFKDDAYQISFVPNLVGPYAYGIGVTTAEANASGNLPYSRLAESKLDLIFTVTESRNYTLYTRVQWMVNTTLSPYNGYSFIQLIDATNNTVPFYVRRDPLIPGIGVLNLTMPLSTGTTYRLQAESKVFASSAMAGVFNSRGNWRFSFDIPYHLIPEPTTATLAAFGLLASLGFARSRNYNRRQ